MMRGLDFTSLAILFGLIIVAITVHEASHALAANMLGDQTSKRLGRLTLNPIAHLDPLGTIMMIITIVGGIGIGWGKPVPVNPYNLRISPKSGMAIVSFAGPASNLVLAALLAGLLRLEVIPHTDFALQAAFSAIQISIVLAVFNLIPLPPLDGFKVLLGLLPDRQAYSFARIENYGPGLLLALIFGSQLLRINVLGWILGPPVRIIFGLLLGGAL